MELSELFVFNGQLYSCDDRTGIIYHLQEGENEEVEPVPWVILADGNGTMAKGNSRTPPLDSQLSTLSACYNLPSCIIQGFKCEWACVKHGYLWVGGLGEIRCSICLISSRVLTGFLCKTGKEWTTNTGEVINHSPQYVKHISATGEVVHMDWRGRYNKLAHAMNIYFPGS
jgi:soluble calcium-activated nucleotidase 1